MHCINEIDNKFLLNQSINQVPGFIYFKMKRLEVGCLNVYFRYFSFSHVFQLLLGLTILHLNIIVGWSMQCHLWTLSLNNSSYMELDQLTQHNLLTIQTSSNKATSTHATPRVRHQDSTVNIHPLR